MIYIYPGLRRGMGCSPNKLYEFVLLDSEAWEFSVYDKFAFDTYSDFVTVLGAELTTVKRLDHNPALMDIRLDLNGSLLEASSFLLVGFIKNKTQKT